MLIFSFFILTENNNYNCDILESCLKESGIKSINQTSKNVDNYEEKEEETVNSINDLKKRNRNKKKTKTIKKLSKYQEITDSADLVFSSIEEVNKKFQKVKK